MKTDLARITSISGPIPLNHLTQRLPTYVGFNAWLDATVSPESREWIMWSESAFHMSLNAYINLAKYQAYSKKNSNSEAKPAESTLND